MTELTNDSNGLNCVLSMLTQASAALETITKNSKEESSVTTFEVKERFAPAQKHEVQLKFWKTFKDPGRKTVNVPMK